MRTETDEFISRDKNDVQALIHGNRILICLGLYASELINKDQARQFATQLLEMCEQKPTKPANTINLNGIYVNKVEK